jgi:hypothetical protein
MEWTIEFSGKIQCSGIIESERTGYSNGIKRRKPKKW